MSHPINDQIERVQSLPASDYFGKGSDLAAMLDRLFISLYTALIAGLSSLLFFKGNEIGSWVGAFFFIGLLLFGFGIAHSILHIAFHAKIMLLMEQLRNGTEHVPNMLEGQEATEEALVRMQQNAQRAFSSQIWCLLWGVVAVLMGLFVHLWQYTWRCGLLVAIPVAILIAIIIACKVWRKSHE